MKKFGNWIGFERMLNTIPAKVNRSDMLLKGVANKVRSSMVTGITHKRFKLAANAQSTIKRKGSSTPLVDDGDLVGSIQAMKTDNGYLVGVHRNAENKDGTKIANIFAIHTYGVDAISKNGKKIKIPKRDAVTPALKENEEDFIKTIENIIETVFTI